MKIMLTLDYELFLGGNSGTLDACILEPTRKLISILDDFNVKACFFVDVGYIDRLVKEQEKHPILKRDYDRLTQQISQLYKAGHDIQLHVHPHWEDCVFRGGRWIMDTTRFRLHDFEKSKAAEIIARYTAILENIIEDDVFAYRAGGWCIQPFSHFADALKQNGITVDSTIYRDGRSRAFDFTGISQLKPIWRFDEDPLIADPEGDFLEIPISEIVLSPLFYWKLALTRKLGKQQHKASSDGSSVPAKKGDLIRMLTRFSTSAVSMDGYKASVLEKAFKNHQKREEDNGYFVVIGHPKTFTPYSLDQMKRFLARHHDKHTFTTYRKERSAGEFNNNDILSGG